MGQAGRRWERLPWSATAGRGRLRTAALRLVAAALIGLALLLGLPKAPAAPTAPDRGSPSRPLPFSSEDLARRSPWSRPESYPLSQRPDPALYRPSADWIGRLILPSPQQLRDPQAPSGDWVWIEVEQAPADQQALIGQRLRLRWADQPQLQRLVDTVTTDIRFGEAARRAAEQFNVVPVRLNGRQRVGPLQSLAGARPADDLTVLLEDVSRQGDGLRIALPPVQITGRWQGRVTVLGAAPGDGLLRVRHFNRASGGFDGAEETIRIPSLPPDRFGRRMLDPAGLAGSALNRQGWLIQGAPAADGIFTVQAIGPQALLQLTPQRQIHGTAAGLAHLRRGNWSAPLLRRGHLHSTALVPDAAAAHVWRLGDRALLMHLFGGIGGADGERIAGWTVTGHFAFGEARVVRDAFSGQPRFALRYHQIYANNPNGIVAGSQDWSAYAGNLQRGWLGTRPFSDVLIPLGEEALDAIALQTEILAARYRSGDGLGVALVTAATSCVQDSSQALWIAIRQLRLQGERIAMPPLQRERLQRLGEALDHLLTPFGRVRRDWLENSERVLGDEGQHFETSQRRRDVLLSWRSMLPRGAHDDVAAEMLRAGLPLQLLRTNQIPGADARLEPIAPTNLLGQLPLAGTLLNRFGDSLVPPSRPAGQGWTVAVLLGYGGSALALARRSGLLPRQARWPSPPRLLIRAARLLLAPALLEELLFRGLLLPSPLEGVGPAALTPWIALSVGLSVAYQRLLRGRSDRRWLAQAGLLGLACCLAYAVSASLWPAVLMHWLTALAWRGPLTVCYDQRNTSKQT